LGLNISRQLIEMMNGTISVESTPAKGTTFTITVAFETGSEKNLFNSSQKINETLLKKLSNLRILLAEDNEFNQIVAKDTLQLLIPGIHVDIANNGAEAIEKLKLLPYDLILMDINMPELNGFEAAKIIRQLPPPLNAVYIVAMTASVTRDEIDSCFEVGMNDYVPKPFEQHVLVEKIAKVAFNS
jgi:CheY-like chemotaxis protein